MKKLIGIVAFLLIIYGVLLAAEPAARSASNHFNLARRIGTYGILSLGAGMLIVTGGIDLSIGSVVGLSATVFAMLLKGETALGRQLVKLLGGESSTLFPIACIVIVLGLGALIGLINGLLVTKVDRKSTRLNSSH